MKIADAGPIDAASRRPRRTQIHRLFQERVKDVVSRALQDDAKDLSDLMFEIVAILPSAWQYPAAASARILLGPQEFHTPDFKATAWRQSAPFAVSDGRRGLIEIAYLDEFPDEAEGPFLAEERKLIDSLAEMFRASMERRIVRQALVDSRDSYQEQLRSLATELSLTEERERRMIAADLHDHIGQTLATAKIRLGALGQTHAVEKIQGLLEDAIRYTRSLTFELSSPILYELGFAPAVEQLAERMQEKHALPVTVRDDGSSEPLDDEVKIVLFKAVRELLMNVVKHARANRAEIDIRRVNQSVEVVVVDDGSGLSAGRAAASAQMVGFGLFSIREGLRHLGGEFSIRSAVGGGTVAILRAPLKASDQRCG